MERKIDEFSKDEIIKILNESKSFRESIIHLGYSSNGSGAYSTVKSHLNNLGITIPKYHYYGSGKMEQKIPINEILVENSTYQSRGRLKKRLVKEGILEYKCKCGNTGIWEGKPLSLQLEHKNGKNNDNRIENLAFLCPNCHSQSQTFGGRNNRCSKRIKKIRKPRISKNNCSCGKEIKYGSTHCQKCHHNNMRKVKSRPTYEELINDITISNYTSTGKKYGVSDKTIRKWLHMYNKVNFLAC